MSVLAVEAQHRLAELRGCRGSARLTAGGVGPVSGDKAAVPAQHGGGLHDQEHPGEVLAIEHLGQHAQHRMVAVVKDRFRDLALKDQKLVT